MATTTNGHYYPSEEEFGDDDADILDQMKLMQESNDEIVADKIDKTVNDLINYYLKSETYTRTEVNTIIGNITQGTIQIVQELPQTGGSNVIYLVPKEGSAGDVYNEYIYINNAWELIGTTQIDLTGYATENWVNAQISDFLTQTEIETLITNALDNYYDKDEIDEQIETLQAENAQLKQETKDLRNASYKIYTETPSTNVTLNKTSKNKFIKFGVNGNREQKTVLLPDDYQSVEYIQSSGTQYLATSIVPTDNFRVEADFYSDTTSSFYMFGSRENAFTNIMFGQTGASDGAKVSFNVNGVPTIATTEGVDWERSSNGQRYKVTASTNGDGTYDYKIMDITNNKEFEAKNVQYGSLSGKTVPPIFIFAVSAGNKIGGNTKIYSMKFYDNNVKVFDGIPCYRKSDNVIGMYDSVSDTFLTNQGTGTFAKGTDTTLTTPSPEHEQPINAVGDNGNVNVVVKNSDKNLFYNDEIELGVGWYGNENTQRARFYIPYAGGESYAISFKSIPSNITTISIVESYSLTNSGASRYSQSITNFKETFIHTFNNSATYLILQFLADTTFTQEMANLIELQIEKGSTVTPYTPHESETFNIPCQKPMPGIEDYFDWDNEKEVHGWKKVVLDGTETWQKVTSIAPNTVRFITADFVDINKTGSSNQKFVVSNYFKSLSWSEMSNSDTTTKNATSNYCSEDASPLERVIIRIDATVASTIQEFKAWLAEKYANGTPVYIWYKLEEVEELPFTAEQKDVAKDIEDSTSYYEQTNIFSNDNVSPNFDVIAIGDANLVIDEISQALVANGGV